MSDRTARLRPVRPDERKRPAPPQSVAEAAKTGTHRDLLVAMRERIAKAVSADDCPPRDLAALTRRLQDIAKEIDSLDVRAKQEAKEAAELDGDEGWDAEAI